MAKTTGAAAVAEKPTDALWLAALPTPRITVAQNRLPAPVQAPPAEGVVSGLPAAVTDMALSRDGRVLVAAHYGADAVSIIDASDLTVRATVDGVAEPHTPAVTDRAYVTSAGLAEDGVVAIDLTTGVALATREIDGNLRGLAVGASGDVLFVARCDDAGADLAAVNVETGAMTAIPVSRTPGAALTAVRLGADGTRLYAALVTDDGDAVVVVDVRSRRVLRTVGVSAAIGDIAVHRDGRRVFATGWDDNLGGVLTVVDTGTGRVVDTIAIGMPVTQVALTATHAYLLSGEEIAVVNVATATVVDSIVIGRPVACVAVNSDGSRLYVADYDGTVEARSTAGDARLRAAS